MFLDFSKFVYTSEDKSGENSCLHVSCELEALKLSMSDLQQLVNNCPNLLSRVCVSWDTVLAKEEQEFAVAEDTPEDEPSKAKRRKWEFFQNLY